MKTYNTKGIKVVANTNADGEVLAPSITMTTFKDGSKSVSMFVANIIETEDSIAKLLGVKNSSTTTHGGHYVNVSFDNFKLMFGLKDSDIKAKEIAPTSNGDTRVEITCTKELVCAKLSVVQYNSNEEFNQPENATKIKMNAKGYYSCHKFVASGNNIELYIDPNKIESTVKTAVPKF